MGYSIVVQFCIAYVCDSLRWRDWRIGSHDRDHGGAGSGGVASALALHEPLGVSQITALVFTLAAVGWRQKS